MPYGSSRESKGSQASQIAANIAQYGPTGLAPYVGRTQFSAPEGFVSAAGDLSKEMASVSPEDLNSILNSAFPKSDGPQGFGTGGIMGSGRRSNSSYQSGALNFMKEHFPAYLQERKTMNRKRQQSAVMKNLAILAPAVAGIAGAGSAIGSTGNAVPGGAGYVAPVAQAPGAAYGAAANTAPGYGGTAGVGAGGNGLLTPDVGYNSNPNLDAVKNPQATSAGDAFQPGLEINQGIDNGLLGRGGGIIGGSNAAANAAAPAANGGILSNTWNAVKENPGLALAGASVIAGGVSENNDDNSGPPTYGPAPPSPFWTSGLPNEAPLQNGLLQRTNRNWGTNDDYRRQLGILAGGGAIGPNYA